MGNISAEQERKWDEKATEVAVKEQGWEESAKKAEGEQSDREERLWKERPQLKERKFRRKRKRNRFYISATICAKVLAFLLFVVTFFVGVSSVVLSVHLESQDFYSRSEAEVLADVMYGDAEKLVEQVEDMILDGNLSGAEAFLAETNVNMELWFWTNNHKMDEVIWSTWEGDSRDVVIDYYFAFAGTSDPVSVNGHIIQSNRLYLMKVYIDRDYPVADEFREMATLIHMLYQYRYEIIMIAVGSVLLCFLSFIFLMCGAGRRNGREGVQPGVLTGIPLDILTAIWAVVVVVGIVGTQELYDSMGLYHDIVASAIYWISMATILAVWLLFYFLDVAIRIKSGNFLKSTLVYAVLGWICRMLVKACKVLWKLFCKIPLVWKTVLVYWGITFVEMMGLYVLTDRGYNCREEMVPLWILGKIVIFFAVLYIAVSCKNLKKAGEALAEGQENYKVDTTRMFGDFKEHGENLNSIGQGISRAVEARMKSEHMKTELITNVSHDIKTPLTSIINYADLICEEHTENAKIAEYSEVLLRQSKRLKKLLDDLVDASKATTGNLEVNLLPCEVGVLLTQAAGEYEQRMEEKDLHLIVKQPEEPLKIMADGRHLWRVFDNLLNNICKYAQEGSRVYLNLDKNGDMVVVTFRNMSKYALEVSPEELEERFVRGDKSRHMEGNGLGLSIAKSLVELQNGKMEIVIDGDLFKVSVGFKELVEK